MTSTRPYAVAALLVAASVSLGACSQADSPTGEAKPGASQAAYPQPAFRLDHEQLRAVATVGTRLVDNSPSAVAEDEVVMMGFCDDAYSGAKGQSWFVHDAVLAPEPGMPAGMGANESTQIGWTFTAATLLDESPSAARLVDERIRGWATCQPKDDAPLTTQKVAIPGAAAAVVRTQVAKNVSAWNAHGASGIARVENVVMSCTINARTAKVALATTTSCLTEMAQSVPFAAGRDMPVTGANRVAAAKTLLARVPVKDETVTVRAVGGETRPCETSKQTFLAAQTPFAYLESGPPVEAGDPATTSGPLPIGAVTAERAVDAAAGKAKVAAARKTFGGCKGSYTKGAEPYVAEGKVTGVADVAFGDGGFTITSTQQFRGQNRAETVQKSIFSVGPYVVEMSAATPKGAQALAARLKAVSGS